MSQIPFPESISPYGLQDQESFQAVILVLVLAKLADVCRRPQLQNYDQADLNWRWEAWVFAGCSMACAVAGAVI